MNLEKILRVPIYFKIVEFFDENPASIDTPRGLSAWTGEGRNNVKKALMELVGLKILTAHKTTSTTGYSYTRDTKMVKKIKAHLKKRMSLAAK